MLYKFDLNQIKMQKKILEWSSENNKQMHGNGYIILGPPGIGKTIFVGEHSHQWVDADEIFPALGIHTEYWHSVEHSEQEQREHYVACDHALGEMRDAGLWVIGSLFWEFKADAIVLLGVYTHKSYVKERCDLSWAQVEHIRIILEEIAQTKKIPIYNTIEDAAHQAVTSVKQFVKKCK